MAETTEKTGEKKLSVAPSKTLNLKGTQVTDVGVQTLQQALPNLKVER